ncbi:MAG: DUF58 domain-containing protein [Planctomycetaceae bacterium]|nr:DUF58 domain-containing protein [Planctomycetaceae bacterium]
MGYRSRVVVPLFDYFWRFKLTPAGRMLVMALMLSAFGFVSIEIPVYQVFCGLFGLLLAVEPLGLLLRPRLDVEGAAPAKVRAEEPFTITLRLKNGAWRPAFDLMATLAGLPKSMEHLNGDAYLPSLRSGQSGVLPVNLVARRRGVHRLPPIEVHSTFPFNLMRFGGSRLPAQSMMVLPAYQSVERWDVPLSQRYQPGGVLLTPRLGNSVEYIGNREYQPGEPVRHFDTRAWARLGRPVVREYQEEYLCRVAIILDTYIPRRLRPGRDGFPQLEAAVKLTAAAAEAMSTGDYLIDFFAAGPNLHVFRSSGNRASFDSVLEILASVDASRSDPFEQVSPVVAEEMLRISTAICILLDWDDSRRQLAEHIVSAGCALQVIVVRDDPTTLPFRVDGDLRLVTASQVNHGQLHSV